MTFNDLKAYFAAYAATNVDLLNSDSNKSFIAIHTDKNADDFVKTCKSPIIMVLITYDKKMLPPQAENYNWDVNACFFIIKKVGTNKEADITDAQDACEQVVDDFFTVMVRDRHTLLTGFMEQSFTMHPVGPMFDNFYGQMAVFSIIDNMDQIVNPARWTS